jgi:hypothetical protein
MNNHRDQMKKTGSSDKKPLQRWVILMLSIAFLIIIIFVAFVGVKLLGFPKVEATSTTTPEVGELPPNLQATATAGCAIFMQQFPGTPCPEVELLNIVGTATAACRIFNSQFPGTPCP